MSPAERFARLPELLAADADLRRRGRWLDVDCRVDIGAEPFYLTLREGALADLRPRAASAALRRRSPSAAPTMPGSAIGRKVPEPGWHDLFALTKRGAASIEGDLRPLLQNLQYFKDLLALPRRLPEAG